MRLNKYLSEHTLLSRRKADQAVIDGRVLINGALPEVGVQVSDTDSVTLDGRQVAANATTKLKIVTILLNKPVGYVCSKNGQGSRTIYSLLPKEYQRLNIAGRLDKDSSGLVLLTNDGDLLNDLTHPSNNKRKVYIVQTDTSVSDEQAKILVNDGVDIGEKQLCRFGSIQHLSENSYEIVLTEGRNRQIRKMLNKLHISVESLHRTSIDTYSCGSIPKSKYKVIQ